ncbi:DUF4097 domain-containing protein (plasmid) [Vibrio pelagius]|uniref:DUF4097 domain-containing protein n=1 Tax=Vibrio pelagius TaxID=28169 RepID=A0ABY5GAU8_VIBPE|nr:DUF4097 domain-containing protein [Vibrio pelagius]UTT87324.1 DUF4097 domain-containing protein [Vibrio pelagius]
MSGSITGISGGASFEKLEYNGDAQSTGVTDTGSIDTVKVDLSADVLSIAEGVDGDNQPNQITYTATLSGGVAKNDITVTLANDEVITIKAGETSGSVSVNVQGDDVYKDGETIENSIKEVSEGSANPQLENLEVADNTDVSVTVEDTIDTVTAHLTASETVAEGGEITYTVTLRDADNNPVDAKEAVTVTVTLPDGTTTDVEIGADSSSNSVTFTVENDIYDIDSVSGSITGISGGASFEKLEYNGDAQSTGVTDTGSIDTVKVDLSADVLSIAEGVDGDNQPNQITYTATLSGGVAKNDITVTLANDEVITIKAGETSGSVSVNVQGDDVYKDGETIENSIKEVSEGSANPQLENLEVADNTDVSVTVEDTIDTVTAHLTASETVAEGGEITYTVTLRDADNNPVDAKEAVTVTVTLPDGTTTDVEIGADSSSNSVTFTVENDIYDIDSVSGSITGISGGASFEKLEYNGDAQSTGVTDTGSIDTVKVDLSADVLSIAEGVDGDNQPNQITYTATLSGGVAKNDITVTLANDEVITIKAGETSGSVSVNVQGDDVYKDGETIENSIKEVSEGSANPQLENLEVADNTDVSVTVEDTIDTVTAHLTASETVAEGGEITYTVTLRDADNNPVDAKEAVTVTVTLPDGTTTDVEIGADSSSNSVTFTVENDIYDIDSVSGSITGISGGASFEKLEYNGDAQSTGVTDTGSIDTVKVDLSADVLSIAEGVDGDNQPNQITYTATLSGGVAKNDITVTLANDEVITIKAGETSGSVSVNVQGDDVYKDGETIENSIKEVSEGSANPQLENLEVADNTDVSVTVEDTIDTVTAHLTASETVAEGGEITYTVTLRDADNNPVDAKEAVTVTVTLPDGTTTDVEIGADSSSNSVTFTVENDIYDIDSVSGSITGISGGASFEKLEYNGDAQSTGVTDTGSIDTVKVDLSADVLSIAEGVDGDNQPNQITYTATLSGGVAKNDITVTLANDEVITIKAGETSGSVSVNVQGDDVYKDGETIENSIKEVSEGSANPQLENLEVADNTDVSVTVEDTIDTVTAHLTASETVAEGGEITYTVTLRDADNNPVDAKEAVTVTVTLPDGTTTDVEIGADSSSNSVTFTVENDIYDIDSVSGSITGISGGASFEKLEYNGDAQSTGVTDTGSIDTVKVDLSADVLSIAEGVDGDNQPNQITYTATLSGGVAKNDITVTLANDEVITIKAGETSGSVSVNVQGDDVYKDGETIENSIKEVSEGSANPQLENLEVADNTDVSVTVEDTIDTVTAHLTASETVAEGGEITYTVTLRDADNNPVDAKEAVTVTVTLPDGTTTDVEIGADSSSNSVTFTVENDIYDIDSVSGSITGISGGASFEKLEYNGDAQSTGVTDTGSIDTVKVDLSADVLSIAEGVDGDNQPNQITYTATLSGGVAKNDITVTLANDEVITIKAGETSGSVSVNVQGDDVYKDGETIENSIKEVSEGSANPQLENLEVADNTDVSVTVEDTIDTVTAHLTASETVAEGGEITYTVTLRDADNNPVDAKEAVTVTVTLPDGTTTDVEIGADSSSNSVTFTVENDIYDIDSVSGSITGISGGASFEKLEYNGDAQSTGVTDTGSIDTVKVDLSADVLSIAEGVDGDNQPNQITYTATLSGGVAKNDITVTLANDEVITIKAGETSGSVSVNVQGDDVYKDGETIENSIKEVSEGSANPQLENLEVADNTDVSVTVEDTIDTVTAHLTASETVAEGGEITYTVTLRDADNNPVDAKEAVTVTVTLPDGTTTDVEIGADSSSNSVTFTVENDIYDIDSVSGSITGISGGASFEKLEYNGDAQSTGVTDTGSIDTVKVDLSADVLSIAEGVDGDNQPNQITYTATLSGGVAKNDITVTLANDEVITIKAGETSGSVSVNVQGDDVYKDARPSKTASKR